MLSQDEYQNLKNDFMSRYEDELEELLSSELKDYVKEETKEHDLKEFLQNYTGGFFFVFMIGFFACGKKIFTLSQLFNFCFLEFFIFIFVYEGWKKDIEYFCTLKFPRKTIISRFIYKKMLQEVDEAKSEDELNKIAQFYSIALYDIPRNWTMNFDIRE